MDILNELVAKGVAGEVIVAVARLIADHEQVERRRASNRERMRSVRTRAHTGAHMETQVRASSFLREEDLKKEKKEEVAKRKTGTKLPPDWKPRQQEIDEGLKLGWSLIGIEAKADDMRIWAEANSNRAIARKADWHATFRGMLRRDKPKTAAPAVSDEEKRAALAALERDRWEQRNGKRHETGIRPDTGLGQKRPGDKGQLRSTGGSLHGDDVEGRQIANTVSSVVRFLRS